jgi:hypothetical protein
MLLDDMMSTIRGFLGYNGWEAECITYGLSKFLLYIRVYETNI